MSAQADYSVHTNKNLAAKAVGSISRKMSLKPETFNRNLLTFYFFSTDLFQEMNSNDLAKAYARNLQ